MNLLIRKAESEDAAAIRDIRNAAILSQCRGHYPEDALAIWTAGSITDRFVNSVSERWHVATVDGTVVGTGMLDGSTGHLDAIFVRPDMLRRGIATRMMAYLETIAVASGLKTMTLDSTLNAAPFYRRIGFTGDQLSTYQSPRGITLDCIPMTKDLPKS